MFGKQDCQNKSLTNYHRGFKFLNLSIQVDEDWVILHPRKLTWNPKIDGL